MEREMECGAGAASASLLAASLTLIDRSSHHRAYGRCQIFHILESLFQFAKHSSIAATVVAPGATAGINSSIIWNIDEQGPKLYRRHPGIAARQRDSALCRAQPGRGHAAGRYRRGAAAAAADRAPAAAGAGGRSEGRR